MRIPPAKYRLSIRENVKLDSGETGHSERLYFKTVHNWCGLGKGVSWYIGWEPQRSFGVFYVGHPSSPPRGSKIKDLTKSEVIEWVKAHRTPSFFSDEWVLHEIGI